MIQLGGKYNILIKLQKQTTFQNILARSNNIPRVLWEFVNRERGSPDNAITSNIHLQDGNEVVSSPSRTCNIFNKTLIGTVNKLIHTNKQTNKLRGP
jgi:hypothetical protein